MCWNRKQAKRDIKILLTTTLLQHIFFKIPTWIFITSKDIQHFHYICKLNLIHLLKSWKILKQSKKHLAKLVSLRHGILSAPVSTWVQERGCKHAASYNMHRLYWPSFCCAATLLQLCFTLSRESCRDTGSGRKSICFWALHKITRFKLANHLESTWGKVSLGMKSLNPGSLDLGQARREMRLSRELASPALCSYKKGSGECNALFGLFLVCNYTNSTSDIQKDKDRAGLEFKVTTSTLRVVCDGRENLIYAQKTTA